ncbi:hypothetical protein [Rhodococcus sp. NPDC058521]|uniref:LIC_13387 family protein n=1 Tax=Rhodococcus sp. NPDC058521 TaxID=3346536 RepID=UPI003661D424
MSNTNVEAARRLHVIGAGLVGFIGVAHIAVVHVFGKPSDGERAVHELAEATPVRMFERGITRSVHDLDTGYSVAMGLLAAGFSATSIAAVRQDPALLGRRTPVSMASSATAVAMLVVAAKRFPEVPVGVIALGAACLGAAQLMSP